MNLKIRKPLLYSIQVRKGTVLKEFLFSKIKSSSWLVRTFICPKRFTEARLVLPHFPFYNNKISLRKAPFQAYFQSEERLQQMPLQAYSICNCNSVTLQYLKSILVNNVKQQFPIFSIFLLITTVSGL